MILSFKPTHFYLSGLEPKTLSRHVPAIMHISEDGFLPKVNITTTDAESRIEFLLCYKSDEAPNTNFEYVFPYAVLSYTQVCVGKMPLKS